jgi:hypothetical protein
VLRHFVVFLSGMRVERVVLPTTSSVNGLRERLERLSNHQCTGKDRNRGGIKSQAHERLEMLDHLNFCAPLCLRRHCHCH